VRQAGVLARLPEIVIRFFISILIHTMYRVKKSGLENIPHEGPAVLVCNHVTFVDALVICSASRRPIRFVMDHQIFKIPVLSFLFRTGRAIPIAPQKEDAALMERAFDDIAQALAHGDLLCIFPEGRLTRTGEMSPFRAGVERILQRSPVPVVPLALRGLWGSFFSRQGGAAMRRPFRRRWSRVELVGGNIVPAVEATAEVLQARVAAMRGDAQ
jgi:1-acyl-sn-glycerol-3-phosphate acyltransferase